jgi:hypothetical protein
VSPSHRWEGNIQIELQEIGMRGRGMDCYFPGLRKVVGFFEFGNDSSAPIYCREFIGSEKQISSRVTLPRGVNSLVG